MPRGRYAKRYGAAAIVNAVGSGMFYPFALLFFSERLDIPLVRIGVYLTVASGFSALAVTRTSRAVDRFGARDVIVTLAAARAVLFPLYLVVDHLAAFFLVVVAVAVADRTDMAASQAVVSTFAEDGERPAWFALSRLALNAGLGAGALLGGLLIAATDDYTWIVLVNAASFAAVALLYLLLPSRRVPRPAEAAPRVKAPVWRDRLFVTVCGLNGLWLVLGLAVEVGLPVYLVVHLGQPEWSVGFVFAVNTALVTLFQLPLSKVVSTRREMRMFGSGLIAYAVTFVVFLVTRDLSGYLVLAFVVVAVCVFTVGEMVVAVTGMVVVNGLAPPERLGAYVGVSHLFSGVGSAVAPLVYTAGFAWSPRGLWAILAGVALGIAATSFRLQSAVAARLAPAEESPDVEAVLAPPVAVVPHVPDLPA